MSGLSSGGAVRALAALLQANGARVRLRMPTPAASGDESEELGLATPGFADVELGRGVLRAGPLLIVDSGAVEAACSSCSVREAAALFAGAAGVVVGDQVFRLAAWRALWAGGEIYGYCLTLAM